MTVPAPLGDTNFLASYLIHTRVYGVVLPSDTQSGFVATYEIQGDQGTLMIGVAVGPKGVAGADMFLMNLQNDLIEDPADLPQTLTNASADIGKFWMIDDVDANGDIIGSSAYVWYGTTFRRLMFGEPGPPGPVPIITPSVTLKPYPGTSYVGTGGTKYEPTMDFELAVPPGPPGPGAALAVCPDVDLVTNPPVAGDILGCNGTYVTGYLAPPSLLQAEVGYGGTWTAGTYYWVVTATNADGETTVSNEVQVTVTATSSVLLAWQAPAGQGPFGPSGYKIYRGSTAGGENTLVAVINSGVTTTYTDKGTGTTSAGTPPSTNSATVQYPQWVPVSISQLMPHTYSMPEASFTGYSGISQQAGIGSFAIPPQPFAWTPIVWGHFGAFGIELSANPLLIGCQVLLGNPTTGALVGRGFGNSLGEVNVMPHYSTPNNIGQALTPTNGLAVVPANHSNPADGTLYINLYNDGEIGLYTFSPTDAQLFVMLMPVLEPGGEPTFSATAPTASATAGGGATIRFPTPTGTAPFTYTAAKRASLVPITSLAATGSATGGTLAAGTHYWVVTATNINGESTSSNEVQATTTGTTSSAALSWASVPGASGYNVYRGTTAGHETVLVASVTNAAYTDTGTSTATAAPPVSDSTASPFSQASLTSVTGTISGSNTTLTVTSGTLTAGIGYAFDVTVTGANGAIATSQASNIVAAQS